MTINDFKAAAAQRVRDLRRLSPYLMGRALRRWYLRTLLEHYLISAAFELAQAQEHQATADHFCDLANALRPELDAALRED